MLGDLHGRALFDGFRGSPPADRKALVDTLLRIFCPRRDHALDLNPVTVHAPGEGAVTVDARIRLAFS